MPTTAAYDSSKPLVSVGAGCQKAQVGEFREFIQQRRLRDVAIRDDGKVEFTSRAGRREFLRARGMHDMDGGFGDG